MVVWSRTCWEASAAACHAFRTAHAVQPVRLGFAVLDELLRDDGAFEGGDDVAQGDLDADRGRARGRRAGRARTSTMPTRRRLLRIWSR